MYIADCGSNHPPYCLIIKAVDSTASKQLPRKYNESNQTETTICTIPCDFNNSES